MCEKEDHMGFWKTLKKSFIIICFLDLFLSFYAFIFDNTV